jgi:hypothetical protein
MVHDGTMNTGISTTVLIAKYKKNTDLKQNTSFIISNLILAISQTVKTDPLIIDLNKRKYDCYASLT